MHGPAAPLGDDIWIAGIVATAVHAGGAQSENVEAMEQQDDGRIELSAVSVSDRYYGVHDRQEWYCILRTRLLRNHAEPELTSEVYLKDYGWGTKLQCMAVYTALEKADEAACALQAQLDIRGWRVAVMPFYVVQENGTR